MNKSLIEKIEWAMREASKIDDTVYYDIDGTLIEDKHLTDLGKWVVEQGRAIDVLTFGGWSKKMLEDYGLKIKTLTVGGIALEKGLADFDSEGEFSKKVNFLIDNENHTLTKHLIKI